MSSTSVSLANAWSSFGDKRKMRDVQDLNVSQQGEMQLLFREKEIRKTLYEIWKNPSQAFMHCFRSKWDTNPFLSFPLQVTLRTPPSIGTAYLLGLGLALAPL